MTLAKLLPTEKIVSCCKSKPKEDLYLISKNGKFFAIKNDEIYFSDNSKLGYLNEKITLKKDYFIKILPSKHFLDIETNKNKSARLNFDKLNSESNKKNITVDFLNFDDDEYIENCFRLKNYLN